MKNDMQSGGIFSIGYSVHTLDEFLALLQKHKIDVVADVRSSPFSTFSPEFNRERLASSLQNSGIKYTFFGKELGARSDDPLCYVNGKVQYDRLEAKEEFQHIISRLTKGAVDHRIVLMCAEKEPLDCHRTILVSEALMKARCEVNHIHADGSLELHSATLDRLLEETWVLEQQSLFQEDSEKTSREERLQGALKMQEAKIAYQK